MRFDIAPEDINTLERHFEIAKVWRGEWSSDAPTLVVAPLAGMEFELGAPYVLFLRRSDGEKLDGRTYDAVRIWWPHADPLETWLRANAVNLTATAQAGRMSSTAVIQDLTRALDNPVTIVRHTAAHRLHKLVTQGANLGADVRRRISERAASEPNGAVKTLLHELSAGADE